MSDHIREKLAAMRSRADARDFADLASRRRHLQEFHRSLIVHRDVILSSLAADLGKPKFETLSAELMPLLEISRYLSSHLTRLCRPQRLPVSPLNFPARGQLRPEPYGLALVIATWNYPLLLSLEPVLGAYAAGNLVVLKLSHRSHQTMNLVRYLIEKHLPPDQVLVIDDELSFDETLAQRFDYIFFTGSAPTGRKVLRAAAEHFTPVTLEMGGKSPCIVDVGANLHQAAKRIVWGKFSNAGQTCVAPDCLYVAEKIHLEFQRHLADTIREFYGDEPLQSPDLGQIVDADRYNHLSELISHGRLIVGGEKDPVSRKIAPTVIDALSPDDPLWQEEVFGPILPMRCFASNEELQTMLPQNKPLALYYFGKDRRLKRYLLDNFSSGAVVFNDVVTHFLNFHFPFGGVGPSGMGAYHGKRTFSTFCHYKPVMKKSAFWDFSLRFPPYGKMREMLLDFLTRR